MRWPQLTTLLYFLFAVMVGVPFSAFSDEPPYPQWETMYPMEGDIGNNILHIECSLMEPKTPTCDLQQLLFLKPDPHSIDHLDEMTSLLMDMCPEMESEPGFSWHDPETERNITEAQSGPEGIEDVLSFCRARSQVERLAVMRRMVESGKREAGQDLLSPFLARQTRGLFLEGIIQSVAKRKGRFRVRCSDFNSQKYRRQRWLVGVRGTDDHHQSAGQATATHR